MPGYLDRCPRCKGPLREDWSCASPKCREERAKEISSEMKKIVKGAFKLLG